LTEANSRRLEMQKEENKILREQMDALMKERQRQQPEQQQGVVGSSRFQSMRRQAGSR